MTATEAPPLFEAMYRFPHRSKRWKSVGAFATEAAANAALTEFLKERRYRFVDRWVHEPARRQHHRPGDRQMTMTTPALTFEKLAELEPLLRVIEAEVKAAAADLRRKRTRCANKCWYGPVGGNGFKDWLVGLVGWYRHGRKGESAEAKATLSSREAFDTCYEFLFRLLPDCRNCACL